MALSDFTITLEIEEGPVADALEADPLLHQKIIDAVNDFVNNKTYQFLYKKVNQSDSVIAGHVRNRDFDALTADYRGFDEFTRYLLSITNDNVRQLVGKTIDTVARDKTAVARYKGGVVFKMTLKIAGIAFSITTMAFGTASAVVGAIGGFGVGAITAIPGLLVGFVGLVQSAAELAQELFKALESLEMARVDALHTLNKVEKKYKDLGGGGIGQREVFNAGLNKVFSGFVDINTITTLSGKFGLWESKIKLVDQKTHKMARKLPELLQKADEAQLFITKANAPAVPSRVGCNLKVPPPVPSRVGRRPVNSSGILAPNLPSSRGRIPASVYRDIYSARVPPAVPSRVGRGPVPVMNTPSPDKARLDQSQSGQLKGKRMLQLSRVRGKVMKLIPEIGKLQKEVDTNKKQNQHYTIAVNKLKQRKPRVVEFIEAFENVAVDLGKAGISIGAGAVGLGGGVATAKAVTETVHSIGSFVVESMVESAFLANDLVEGVGELGQTLNEKDRLDRQAHRARV